MDHTQGTILKSFSPIMGTELSLVKTPQGYEIIMRRIREVPGDQFGWISCDTVQYTRNWDTAQRLWSGLVGIVDAMGTVGEQATLGQLPI